MNTKKNDFLKKKVDDTLNFEHENKQKKICVFNALNFVPYSQTLKSGV